MNYKDVRGFNYQPSYGSSSFENWMYFNPVIFELELRRGKHYFPKMNVVRLWLAWDAFVRNPVKFSENFEKSLKITESLGLLVVPVLFNRWHNTFLDCGGLYIDHFMPGWGWAYQKDLFQPYLDSIVGSHKSDKRIMAWDICNEPFSYLNTIEEMREIESAEYKWLEEMYASCKDIGTTIPLGISIHPMHGRKGLERVVPISDILLVHPYFMVGQENSEEKAKFIGLLDDYADIGNKSGKPMLTTETCWGSLDDHWRVENIRYTLNELKKRNIGWIVHALHHSLVADLHRPEFGPVGEPGNLAFIEADGTLRAGHDIFNDF